MKMIIYFVVVVNTTKWSNNWFISLYTNENIQSKNFKKYRKIYKKNNKKVLKVKRFWVKKIMEINSTTSFLEIGFWFNHSYATEFKKL